MSPGLLRQSARYGAAILASGTALLVQRVLSSYIGPGLPTYLLFYPAVMLTATVGGLGPGLLATAVSALLAAYFILPRSGRAAGSPVDLLGRVIFAWMGTGISLVAAWYRRPRDRAARPVTDLAGPAEEAALSSTPQRLGAATGAVPRRVPLRRWLTLLVLGTALPLLLFAIVVLGWLVGEYRADQDRRQTDTTRALALAADAEIRSWKIALEALAGSHELQDDRLASFYQEAVAVAARHGGWIFLYDPSGQQRLNTLRPFGIPLPRTDAPALWQAFFRDRQPLVTDLLVGPIAHRDVLAVAVPVIRDGQVRYALGLGFTPERLVRLLTDQRFPAAWITAINDGRQRVIARAPDRPDRRGQPVVPPLARAFAAQTSGAIETPLSDGRVGRNTFQRLREAPWTVNVTVPVTELQAAWQRPVVAFLLLGALAALGAIGLAVRLARKIARPVTEAATHATTVVQGQPPALVPSGITEVAVLQDALVGGAASVRTALQAREEALTALRQANEALETRVTERTAALETLHAEQREQRDRLVALINSIRDEVWFADPEKHFTLMNPEACREFAVAAGDVVDVEHLAASLEVLRPDGSPRPVDEAPPLRALRGEVVRDQEEWVRTPATGEVRIRQVNAAPVHDAAGHIIGSVSVVRDITARKRAETALRQTKEDLEQRVQERTAELTHKASQLQALTAELTLAEQRERRRLAVVLHDGLQQLLVAAKFRLIVLPRADPSGVVDGCREVTGLLEEAIASARKLTGELSPPILETGGLVAGLEWLVRWKAEKYRLAVELDADPLAVPDSEATTLLLFQSVRELLFNVVKHAQVRTARVEVRQQEGHLQIVVSDQGVGFDPATLPATSIGGLGLSSIRQRLEFLGGCADIATAPGHGCRITLVAPLQSRASVPPSPVTESKDGPSIRRPGRGVKIRILLVDDHAVVRQAMARLLGAESDLEVVGEAADGKIGVDLTKQLQPDIVLMDINMPVLNGMEATQQIRAECPGVQVIGLSMFGAAEQADAMRNAGAVAYVSKAAPAEELLAVIRSAVR